MVLFFPFDCHQKRRHLPEETANKWRQRVKAVMAGVKLVHFIQIYGETQTMSNYGRHKLIVLVVEPLFNIHVQLLFSPLFGTQKDTVFTCSGDGTAWLIFGLPY
ncbi:unnamed protein product [Lepidochelys olivacea]